MSWKTSACSCRRMVLKHYNAVNAFLLAPRVQSEITEGEDDSHTVREIRRRNLLLLIGGDRVSDFARQHGVSEKYIRLVQHEHAGMGNNFARKLERATGRPSGWMDTDHSLSSQSRLDPDAAAVASRWCRLPAGRR